MVSMNRGQFYLSLALVAFFTFAVSNLYCKRGNEPDSDAKLLLTTLARTRAEGELSRAHAELEAAKAELFTANSRIESLQSSADSAERRAREAADRAADAEIKARRAKQEAEEAVRNTQSTSGQVAAAPPTSGTSPSSIGALPKASGVVPSNSKTSYKCYTSSDWAQICVYNLMCTDGDKVVLIDDSQPAGTAVPGHFGIGDNAAGYHTFDVFPRPPPPTRGLPLNTRAGAYYAPSSVLANAVWTDKSMWLIEPEYRSWEIQHIFFFSHAVFPMWEAQQSNETWGSVMPPIEEVYIMSPAKYKLNDWGKNILSLMLPPTAEWNHIDALSSYSKDRLRCTRRGIISGNKPNLFSGMKPAFNFRARAYAKFAISMPRHPPKKLVIFNRANAGRRFENIDEMEALFRRYEIPYQIVSKHGTFEDQVRTMSGAGVLMLAHGAAATNTMFQPHRSVFIEVFPYMRKRFGFMTIAQTIGNFYYPIFAWTKPTEGKLIMDEQPFIQACDHLASIHTNSVGTCDQAQKVVTIRVDIAVLERTLIESFDSIGYRIYDKNKNTIPNNMRS